MTRIFQSPIARIALLGILVAIAVLVLRGPGGDDRASTIVVTGADVLDARVRFQRTWQREPSAVELRRAVEQHVRQEILYREALARGYDRGDPAVRRAMQQKMDFLAVSQLEQSPPTDDQVEAFFALRREQYRIPAVLTFLQVYLDPDDRGEDVGQRARDLLVRIRDADPAPGSVYRWGDRTMLPPLHERMTADDVERSFGGDFASGLVAAETGVWSGPVTSGLGVHLVKILDREESRVPELDEVLTTVMADLRYEAGQAAREQLYQEVARNYRVVLDRAVSDVLQRDPE